MIEVRDMIRYSIELSLTAVCLTTFLIAREQIADIQTTQQEVRNAYTSGLTLAERVDLFKDTNFAERDLYNRTTVSGAEVASFLKYKWDEDCGVCISIRELNSAGTAYTEKNVVGQVILANIIYSGLFQDDYLANSVTITSGVPVYDPEYTGQLVGDYVLKNTIVDPATNLTLEERLKNSGTFRAHIAMYSRGAEEGMWRYVTFEEIESPEEAKLNKETEASTSTTEIAEIKKFLVESMDFIEDYEESGKNYIDDKYSKYAYKTGNLSTLNDWTLDEVQEGGDLGADGEDDDYFLSYENGLQSVFSGNKETTTFTGRLNHSAAILRSLIKKYTDYVPQNDSESAKLESTIKALTGGVVLSSGDNIEGSDEGMFALASYEGDKEFLAVGNIFEDTNASTRTHTGSRLIFQSENLYTLSKINYEVCTIQTGAFSTTQGKKVKTLYLTGNTKIFNNAFGEITENGDIVKKSGLENLVISQADSATKNNTNKVVTKVTLYPKSLAGCSDVMVYFKNSQFIQSLNQFRYVNGLGYSSADGARVSSAAFNLATNLVDWYKSIGVSESTAIRVVAAVLNELRAQPLASVERLESVLNSLDASEKSLVKITSTNTAVQIQGAFGAKSIHIIKPESYVKRLTTDETFTITGADIVESIKLTTKSFDSTTGSVMPFTVRSVAYGNEKFLLSGKSIDAYFRDITVSKGTGTQTYKITLPKAYSKAHIGYRTNKGLCNVKTVTLTPVSGEGNTYTFSVNWNAISDIHKSGAFVNYMQFVLGFE